MSERIDDSDVAVQKRLDFFKENTVQVIQHFEKEGKMVEVRLNGESHKVYTIETCAKSTVQLCRAGCWKNRYKYGRQTRSEAESKIFYKT